MDTIFEYLEETDYYLPREELREKLVTVFAASFDKLWDIWEEVGIRGGDLRDRQMKILHYHSDLNKNMIQEESVMRDKKKTNVVNLQREFVSLCDQLGVADRPPYVKNGTLLEREISLKSLVKQLLDQRDARLDRYSNLSKRERELCVVLAKKQSYPIFMCDGEDRIPSEDLLSNLEQHIADLQAEKNGLAKKMDELRHKVKRLVNKLELDVKSFSHFQMSVVSEEEVPLSKDNFAYVTNWLDKLKFLFDSNEQEISRILSRLDILWNILEVEDCDREIILGQHSASSSKTIAALQKHLNEMERQRKANMGLYLKKVLNQLTDLWNKCFIAEDKRLCFHDLTEADYTEGTLSQLEREVENLSNFYDENRELFCKIHKRQELWEHMTTFEIKCHDATRYNNRGGNLLKEERERNALVRDLPRIQQEILATVAKWEESHAKPFTIYGQSVQDYFDWQWREHEAEKENEKMQRRLKRQEDRYNTPKRFQNTLRAVTPSRTTPKKPRLTPIASTSKMRSDCVARSIAKSPGRAFNLTNKKMSLRQQVKPSEGPSKSRLVLANFGTTPVAYNTRAHASLRYNSQGQSPILPKKAPSTSISNHSRNTSGKKVIGSKIVPRYSNEAIRRKSLSNRKNNSIKSRKHLATHGVPFLV